MDNSRLMNALSFIGGLLVGILPLIQLIVILVCVFTSGKGAANWFLRGMLTAFVMEALVGAIILITMFHL